MTSVAIFRLIGVALLLSLGAAPSRQDAQPDYVVREVMIPMRDGVNLHTVIVIPNGASRAPIIMTRTPYNATGRAARAESASIIERLPIGDGVFVADGYIRVFQDVRGKHKSQGEYVIVRPLRGELNQTTTDHSTDAYDTIDWLVKNVPESNGRVGMLGSSYEGFTVVMALIHPHPALKVAAPMSPMVDGWMGDDWFHYGAFRQNSLDFYAGQCAGRVTGIQLPHAGYDDYENYLTAGSAGEFARAGGIGELPTWKEISSHPEYDGYWKGQALDQIIAREPLTVPTMWIQGIWDQEDMWGGVHCYAAVESQDSSNTNNFLVLGPWRHSGVNYDGSSHGPLKFDGDTALWFRRDVLKPFFDQYLKEGATPVQTPPVLVYNTGNNAWDRLQRWPRSCAQGCDDASKRIYLQAGFGLSFDPPKAAADSPSGFDAYVSDPAKPVPYVPRPVRFADGDLWKRWLLTDQRCFSDRTDVLTYIGDPLVEPVQVAGIPKVNLVASTSGTDSDWVVKLIDLYPSQFNEQPEMGGYQLPVAMDIFRGRYRESFEHPKALVAEAPLAYNFDLSPVNHVFQRGHRIVVQVQSSWFPLYDRNPQTFVPNIFFAHKSDFQPATQRVFHATGLESFIELPLVEVAAGK